MNTSPHEQGDRDDGRRHAESDSGEVQPQSLPLTMARISAPTPPVTSAASRARGRGAWWPGIPGSLHQPTTSAPRPMGTSTRKIQRQSMVTSAPPTTGPSAAARAPIAVQTRTAPPRRSGGNAASSRPSDVGVINAAPAAWAMRNATRVSTLLATEQAAEAAVKRPIPSKKLRSRR